MPRILLPFVLALLAAVPAHADLKGAYQLQKDKPLALSFRDDRHMLVAVGADKRLLMKGDETWVLKRQGDNWLAIDANSAAGLLAALRKKHDAEIPTGPVELRSLNRSETVAGYTGEVFELSDGNKCYEVVLTDNADVLALTNAWRKVFLSRVNMADFLQTVLSVVHRYRVHSMHAGKPDSNFCWVLTLLLTARSRTVK